MKKLVFSLMLLIVSAVILTPMVFAETFVGEEMIENGDFPMNAGELAFPDPVFSADYGVAENWGSLSWDSNALALADPDDENNTVLKLSYAEDGQAWSSFFRFLTFNAGTTYHVSIDFKLVGTTDNLGFNIIGGGLGEVQLKDHASKVAIDGKTDWYNVNFDMPITTAGDSISLWFNTLSSADNYVLLDNIMINVEGSTENINIGGDFEGFLDYAPQLTLTETPNMFHYYGLNTTYGNGSAVINNGYFGYELAIPAGTYQSALDFDLSDLGTADLDLVYVGESDDVLSLSLIDDGILNATNVTDNGDDSYSVFVEDTIDLEATGLELRYTGMTDLSFTNLSLKNVYEVDWPFDPETTYYEGENYIINGDFEAFDVDTTFSEEQLEGAWGSVSLDDPAVIASVDGSKVMSIGDTEALKTYASAFVILPPELQVGDLLRLRYDVKIERTTEPIIINSSFVGASNESYLTIDLMDVLVDDFATTGVEDLHMPITVTDLGNDWYTLEMDFEVTTALLLKTNSIRWLFTPANGEFMYVDNVELLPLSDEPVVVDNSLTDLTITQNNQTLNVDDTLALTLTKTPSDNDDALTWSSSNENVATVSSEGVVTAVGKGAATITVTNDNEVSDSIIITVVEEASEGLSTGAIVGIAVGGVAIIGGTVYFFVFKKKGLA